MRRAPLPRPRRLPAPLLHGLALLSLGLAPLALAADDVDVRKGGSHWARIEKGGAVRIDGRIVGTIEKDLDVRVDGRIAGRVESDGAIRDGGRIVGKVEKDGALRWDGTIVGRIEGDGDIRRDGSTWGSASPCCPTFDDTRRLAALLYFFEPAFFER